MTGTTSPLAVGAQFSSAGGRLVTAEEIRAFADLTGDHHPVHLDSEFAARTPFGKPIAHGLLVVSIAVGLLPPEATQRFVMRRFRSVVFRAPVRAGERIGVNATVVSVRVLSAEVELLDLSLRVSKGDGRVAATATLQAMLGPWEMG